MTYLAIFATAFSVLWIGGCLSEINKSLGRIGDQLERLADQERRNDAD